MENICFDKCQIKIGCCCFRNKKLLKIILIKNNNCKTKKNIWSFPSSQKFVHVIKIKKLKRSKIKKFNLFIKCLTIKSK